MADVVKMALQNAIDSPTVEALENVFNGPPDMTKSASERIVGIIAPRFRTVQPAQELSDQAIEAAIDAWFDCPRDDYHFKPRMRKAISAALALSSNARGTDQ